MNPVMRQSTLTALGLPTVLDIFNHGRLPTSTEEQIDLVFGPQGNRGSMVISGANGIVGAGKVMQFSSRLQPFGVNVVALDFPGSADGIGKQYPGLERSFGRERSAQIMSNVIRIHYDGRHLNSIIRDLHPKFLLEAIPENLELKRGHYQLFHEAFPGIEIRSVTSGFPSSQLGVGIAHPSFPHEINKIFEVVEPAPSEVTRLLWSLGLLPIPVGDYWSFVLDVLFCGLTLAGARYHRTSNMPYWKIDKYIRRLLGPNPFRAHDAIGARGATFLTWSCLHHLSQHYGPLFEPTPDLISQKDSGMNWYPLDHFRPLVDWRLNEEEEQEFSTWILGPIFQMVSLMLHERRSSLTCINIIGELCAQFQKGILAVARNLGPDKIIHRVEGYHRMEPCSAQSPWHPVVFERMDTPEWNQLYVNAEQDGRYGVITLAREAYNWDVNAELNRAIDWLKTAGIESVILTSDFHLANQLIGADTADIYPALDNETIGLKICSEWTRTALRFHTEFKTSIGVISGKRCLGGMLELMMHCHFLLAMEDAQLGMPEITLPILPGMNGCHWPFRKCKAEQWPLLLNLLLSGQSVKADRANDWLIDFTGSIESILEMARKLALRRDTELKRREVKTEGITNLPFDKIELPLVGGVEVEAARKAMVDSIRESCAATIHEAYDIQARHSAGFMTTNTCRTGRIGIERQRVMNT